MNPEKETKVAHSNPILRNEAIGFSLLIALSWLTELLHIPHLVFGDPFTPSWHRAVIRTVVLLLIWVWMHWMTRRLLKRLHHLEEFLRICSWCRKVGAGEKWLSMEDFFNSKFATHTTHGMCPDCLNKVVKELEEPSPKKI